MDLSQIQRQIERQLGSSTQDPQVLVDYAADRNNTVMISGDVKNPGRIALSDGTRSVVDLINHAGGLASTPTATGATQPSPASQYEVVLRRTGEVILNKQYSELL